MRLSISEHPLVSVLIITYQQEEYIEKAINGVLMQKFFGKIEIIIADDNSPDNTEKVVNSFSDHPNFDCIKYFKHKDNKGIMPNFLWALNQCKGKYIALCEGDDYWIDEMKLQKQVAFLEKNKDYSIHSGHAQTFKNGKIQDVIGNAYNKNTYGIEDFYVKNNLITCTSMFRNHTINSDIFKGVYFGDWMLYVNTLNYFKGSKAYISEECFSVYRMHELGAMSQLVGIMSDKKHLFQINRIHHFFLVSYSHEDILIINKYALNIYKYFLINNNLLSAFNIFWKHFQLIKFKLPFRTYLLYLRYRKQLT